MEERIARFIVQSIVNIVFWSIAFVAAVAVARIGFIAACFVWNLV